MKWILAVCALLWTPLALFAHDIGAQRHAAVMSMLTAIGYAILDKLDEWKRA